MPCADCCVQEAEVLVLLCGLSDCVHRQCLGHGFRDNAVYAQLFIIVSVGRVLAVWMPGIVVCWVGVAWFPYVLERVALELQFVTFDPHWAHAAHVVHGEQWLVVPNHLKGGAQQVSLEPCDAIVYG